MVDTAFQVDSSTELCQSRAKSKFTLGEIFAGAGGMALGAHFAKWRKYGFKHIWINEIDKDACNTFKHNLEIEPENIYCSDVRELDFSKLERVDGLQFGFPCNDFSVVGDRRGLAGNFGGLYIWCVKGLQTLRPLFFVAENVGGLTSSGKRKDFETIMRAFQDAGYQVYPHKYQFEDYGVPQNRHRIIIVGIRNDLNIEFKHPLPKFNSKKRTSQEALENIPANASNHEFTKQSNTVVERLSYIRPGENAFTADIPTHLQLKMKSGAKISQIYRKLRPDEPSYTVTGSGGGGTHMYHWAENRSLTNRERARLQTFPDDFVFLGGKESVRKQIGMAVPPEGAKVIFRTILKTLTENRIFPSRA